MEKARQKQEINEQKITLSSTHKINILNSSSCASSSIKKSITNKLQSNQEQKSDSPIIPISIKPFSCQNKTLNKYNFISSIKLLKTSKEDLFISKNKSKEQLQNLILQIEQQSEQDRGHIIVNARGKSRNNRIFQNSEYIESPDPHLKSSQVSLTNFNITPSPLIDDDKSRDFNQKQKYQIEEKRINNLADKQIKQQDHMNGQQLQNNLALIFSSANSFEQTDRDNQENFILKTQQDSNIHSKSLSYNYSQTCQQQKEIKNSNSISIKKQRQGKKPNQNHSNSSCNNSILINNESNGNIEEDSTLLTVIQENNDKKLSGSTEKQQDKYYYQYFFEQENLSKQDVQSLRISKVITKDQTMSQEDKMLLILDGFQQKSQKQDFISSPVKKTSQYRYGNHMGPRIQIVKNL